MQGINSSSTNLPPASELHALSRLSPVRGVESIVFVVFSFSLIGGAIFASQLHPLLGGVGASLAILSLSCVAERMVRPLALWALGRHVYMTLTNLAGQHTAGDIARIYGSGGRLTSEALRALICHDQKGLGSNVGARV